MSASSHLKRDSACIFKHYDGNQLRIASEQHGSVLVERSWDAQGYDTYIHSVHSCIFSGI